MRVEQGVTPIPSAMAFQETGSVDYCEQLNQVCGDEMRQIGINMNLAPVLDVNNNPLNPVIGVRAYGEDAATVINYGMAAMRGLQASGLITAAKHFPGHGDTASDSHYGMAVVPHNRQRLETMELPPFKAAIAQQVDAIMTAHVVFPEIESIPDLPATLSKTVITDLLRNELGFQGAIITDCLEMAAISEGVGVTKAAVATLVAGADIVLVSHLIERQIAAIKAVEAAVASGEISAERLDAAAQQVHHLKQVAGVAQWRQLPIQPQGLMRPEAMALSRTVHRAAVRFEGALHVLNRSLPVNLITVEVRNRTEVDEAVELREGRSSMLAAMQAAGLRVREFVISFEADPVEVAAALAFAVGAHQVVLQTYNAIFSEGQKNLLSSLPHDKLWLVAGRLPYDLELASDLQGRLAAFGCRPAALEPVVDQLIGS
jgi:beta-N-acetylhexosaminidase